MPLGEVHRLLEVTGLAQHSDGRLHVEVDLRLA
jgi:hypothetical protein